MICASDAQPLPAHGSPEPEHGRRPEGTASRAHRSRPLRPGTKNIQKVVSAFGVVFGLSFLSLRSELGLRPSRKQGPARPRKSKGQSHPLTPRFSLTLPVSAGSDAPIRFRRNLYINIQIHETGPDAIYITERQGETARAQRWRGFRGPCV